MTAYPGDRRRPAVAGAAHIDLVLSAIAGVGRWCCSGCTTPAADCAVAVQDLLMARLLLLERAAGADRLVRWHAVSGSAPGVARQPINQEP